MAIEAAPFPGASADPFGDLVPKSGDLASLTPKLDEYGPFHDLVKANDPAPAASMAYDNLVGGGTKDAEAYQRRPSGNFEPVPRGVAVSTTDLGQFSDLAGKGREVSPTNYQEEFGIFADMVPPPSPAPEVDSMAARARLLQPMLRPVHEATAEESERLVTGQLAPKESSLLVRLAGQERARAIKGPESESNPRHEEISAPRDIRGEQIGPAPADTFDLSSQGPVSAAIAGAGHAAILSLGDIVKGAAGLSLQHPGLKAGAKAKDKMDFINSSPDPLLQWARQTPELAEKAFPINPREKLAGSIGEAVGGFAPLVAAGPFAPFAIAMQTAGQHISGDYNARISAGEDPEKAARATFQNATLGALTDEAVWGVLPHPLRVAGDKFLIEKFGTNGLKHFLLGRIAQGTEGAVLGAATRIAGNTATGEDLLEGVSQSALGLGVMQLFMPRGGSAPKKAGVDVGTQRETSSKFDELPKVELPGLEEEAPPEAPKIPPSLNPLKDTYTPDELRPALRTSDNRKIPGEPGQTHDDIYKGQPDPTALRAEDPEHGFMDTDGNFLTREQAAERLGEKDPLQSERLIQMQQKAPEQEAPKGEAPKPLPQLEITREHLDLLPEKGKKVEVQLDDFDPDGQPITITRKMDARKASELLMDRAKSMKDFLDCL